MADDLREMLNRLDMEFYAEREGLTYKVTSGQNGAQLNLKECPACGDSRWRTYINAETGLGNCFVCSETFSKWGFIQHHTGMNNAETFRHIREVLHEQGWRPRRTTTAAVEIPDKIHLPASIPLPYEGQNLVYLERRGIDADMAGYFHLRYCEDAWWNYTKEDGSRGGQNFGQRVIIPVFDLDGKLVTFQGRDVTGTSDRKYLFPATLPATGRFLYNGHNVIRTRRVVVGEGAFDVMALKVAVDGEPELRDIVPIGTFGKHLSAGGGSDQLGAFLELRRRGVEEVVFCWDGETAALNAAADAGLLLGKIGLRAKVALLPKGLDPNEARPDVVRQAIWQAAPVTSAQVVRWRLRNPYR
jgi:DNA primase